MTQTNVGIIGYSKGNGHPYSFAAIINGYDADEMQKAPYPVIADYLSVRDKSEFGIGDCKVTHVWAPDRERAQNIADCTNIKNVVSDYKQMTEEVDAVLVLRDDADSHKKLASYFLENDKIVFVDKPLCDNLGDLRYFKPWLDEGRLMSCSGLRYYSSIVNRCEGNLDPEQVVFSHSVSIIDWYRYGVHVLEGITPIMGSNVLWVENVGEKGNCIVRIQYEEDRHAFIHVNTKLGFVLRSSFYTTSDVHFTINYNDNFSCFKGMLEAFYKQFKTGEPVIDSKETETIIKTLIAGESSRRSNGKKVKLEDLKVRHVNA